MKFASKLRETTQKRMLELQEKSSSPWADVTFLEAAIEVLLEVLCTFVCLIRVVSRCSVNCVHAVRMWSLTS
jgi:hypothetical protein